MPSRNAEIWLFFENLIEIDGRIIKLRLVDVDTDLQCDKSNICLHRTHLNSAFPDVTMWTASENINPGRDQLLAISVRLSHATGDFFKQRITWALTFEIEIDEEVQSHQSTFCTNQFSEEGFAEISINHGEVHRFPKFLRFLIIWDVLADPAPGLESSRQTRPKSWLSREASTPLLIGHRGMGAHAHSKNPSEHPGDNTVTAFKEAFAIGGDMVELDVQLSQDDALIIRHDFSVNNGESETYYRDMDAVEILEMEQDTVSLSSVFSGVDRGLGIDVEVKYPMRITNGRLENEEEELIQMVINGKKVLRWPKNKLADLVLKTVEPEAHMRRVFLSTFHPDLALVLSRKIASSVRNLLPVMALTRGDQHYDVPPEKCHLDLRNRTVSSAACWSRAVDLDGVVPFAASVFPLKDPITVFGDDLATVLWGKGLNSVDVLKSMQQQTWVRGLIFDNLNELLPQLKNTHLD